MIKDGFKFALLSIILSSFLGCMLFNPTKRKPLDKITYKENVQSVHDTILVHFSDYIPKKPLSETVWDNNGAFWDRNESHQIGFTQNYKLVPLPGSASVANKGTRIVIPFGRYLTEMTKSAFEKTYKGSQFCFGNDCVEEMLSKQSYDHILTVSVKKFVVWETPMNKINYSVELFYEIEKQGNKINSGTISKQIIDEPLGSPLSSSYTFIAKMKEITNDYTEQLVGELISKALI